MFLLAASLLTYGRRSRVLLSHRGAIALAHAAQVVVVDVAVSSRRRPVRRKAGVLILVVWYAGELMLFLLLFITDRRLLMVQVASSFTVVLSFDEAFLTASPSRSFSLPSFTGVTYNCRLALSLKSFDLALKV